MAAYQAETPVYNTTHNRVQSDTEKLSLNMYTATLSFSLSIAVSRPLSFPHSLKIYYLSLSLSL